MDKPFPPTRRAALIGASAAILAGGAVNAVHGADAGGGGDAELLAACARFRVAHHDFMTYESDAEGEEAMHRWYAEIERITNVPATTEEGRRAKTEAAFLALESVENEGMQQEERLALSALSDLAGRTEGQRGGAGMSAHERPATPESAAKLTFEPMEQIELMPRAKFMEQAAVAYSQLQVVVAMLGKTPAELAAVVAAFAVDSGGDGKGMAELFDEIKSTKERFAGFASVMACIEARTFVAASRVAVAEGLTGQAAQPEPKQPPA